MLHSGDAKPIKGSRTGLPINLGWHLRHSQTAERGAESREQRAESREQRAESREQRAESRKQRAESREQRAESREQKGRVEPKASYCDSLLCPIRRPAVKMSSLR